MNKPLKYLIIGIVLGGILALLPPFHLLSLPIIIPLSKTITGNSLKFIMILTNAIIFGFIGLLIGLFRKGDIREKIIFEGSKVGFIVSFISSLVLLLPFTTIIFRDLYSGSNFYMHSVIIFIYGLFILISSLFLRKKEALKLASIVCIILGAIPIIIGLLSLVSQTIAVYVFYIFLGELLEGGNFLIIVLFIISSILSIVGGIFGLRDYKKSALN
jgi:hypothetical protein